QGHECDAAEGHVARNDHGSVSFDPAGPVRAGQAIILPWCEYEWQRGKEGAGAAGRAMCSSAARTAYESESPFAPRKQRLHSLEADKNKATFAERAARVSPALSRSERRPSATWFRTANLLIAHGPGG